jgi:hypothetical protein
MTEFLRARTSHSWLSPLQLIQCRDEPTGQQEKYHYDRQIDEIHVHTPSSIDGKGNVVLRSQILSFGLVIRLGDVYDHYPKQPDHS